MGVKLGRGHIQNIKARSGKRAPLPRPRNENAYRGCKITIRKFFKKPSRETYAEFQRANARLGIVNPTAAWSLKKLFDKQMFDRALKEEDFK